MLGVGVKGWTVGFLATTALTSPFCAGAALAQNLPTGASVAAGSVAISQPSATQLTVTQSSQSAVVNYQSFSVGQGSAVTFAQPNASSAILNRVTGNTSSTIAGQINANGQVYLVNPNGIAITKSGTVNAGGGFVASTLGISDSDFMAGKRTFTGNGSSAGVSNAGAIRVGRGGYAALIGGTVSNSGSIDVPLGKVGLGSGERATLDFAGDGFLQVAVPTASGGKGALVRNSGSIKADGGSVVLTAATAREAARNAINISGTIQARSISGHNGSITIGGGAGGRVRITGRLDASSRHHGGGRIVVTGRDIKLKGAAVDASGATGGGTINIGGGRQGQGALQRAATVSIDSKTIIKADATQRGNGGDVVVWSDLLTSFAGTISARGGATSGNGGEAEVSGKAKLVYTGFTNLTAANGRFGTLLLDPYNVTISNGADSNQTGFTASGFDSVINAATLLTALGSANVTVSTGAGGGQAGNITLAAPLTWTTGATLTLQAAGGIALNSAINAGAGGGLTLDAGSSIGATGAVSVARFTLTAGDWVQTATNSPAFAAGDFQINGGSFLRAAGGSGTVLAPYLLTDIYGVQGMGTSAYYLSANYKLVNNIDASGTVAWNAGLGFRPVGSDAARFGGNLDGASHTISGLTINRPNENDVGFFGTAAANGSVAGVGLVGGSVLGGNSVGALVGVNYGTVSRSYATGSVSGTTNIGGLVGYGLTNSLIEQSYASGDVAGSNSVGGLVGFSANTISDSYATGSVFASVDRAGGLLGTGSGSFIRRSYASGRVSGNGLLGGLMGALDVTAGFLNPFWDKDSTGQDVLAGNLRQGGGLTNAQARTSAAYNGFDFTTVWYQAGDMRPILRSESAAPVGGVIPISNLHQLQLMGANLAGSYVLTGNIDATATASTAASSGIFGAGGFVPVGTYSFLTSQNLPFTGNLDGAGYTINGLTINRPDQNNVGVGFFGARQGGTISNLGLLGGTVSGGSYTGGLVGLNFGGTIIRTFSTADVSGAYTVGGLVGSNDALGVIDQSYATGRVTGTATGIAGVASEIGGLVGANGYGSISRSYATGNVSGVGGNYIGGLVGNNRSSVTLSYATGNAVGYNQVGGLVGANFGGTISKSYSTGAASSVNGGIGGVAGSNDNRGSITDTYWDVGTSGLTNGIGGTPGQGTVNGVVGLSTTQARSAANYAAFDFSNDWYQSGDLRPILRTEAAAAVNGIIPVSNLHQLQLMNTNLSGNYRLTGDIDASATNATAASARIFGAGGFVPLDDYITGFTGSLDGAGHVITSLTINRPTASYVGLIGYLASSGSVTNLGLVGGSVSSLGTAGNLAGYSAGTITRSFTTGSVSGASSGVNAANVGGLVGYNVGTVSQSYASGNVSGAIQIGGLLGYNNGMVSQSYATGSVSGSDVVGGLVGYHDSNGSIIQTYATGAVSSVGGGLVGYDNGILIQNYWNTQTTGRGNAIGDLFTFVPSTSAAGRTTAQMQHLANFRTNYAGFDFANVWSPPNQAGQGGQSAAYYPQLYALSRVLTVTPVAISRLYGDANPSLIASYNGQRAGDFVTNLGSLTTNATATSSVGSNGVTASGTAVTAAGGASYRILYVPGTLTITARPVTVTADVKNRAYGDANPTLTYTSTSLGAGAALSGTLATVADPTSPVGPYAITQNTLTTANNPNYILTYSGNTLTITARPVTVTADAQSRAYGDANPALTYTTTSLGAGATLSGMLATPATSTSDVGNFPITQGSLTTSSNPNYVLTYIGASLVVTQRPITIAADPQFRPYGTTNPPLTYTVGGRGLVNGDMLTGGLSVAADVGSGLGNYPINLGTLAATPNYRISYQGALLTIVPSVALVDAGAIASRVVSDNIDWIALSEDATPLVGLPAVATTLGVGIFYSDPRFDGVLVCFGGGGGTAKSCFAAR